MSTNLENSQTPQETTIYGAIGIAIFFIFVGIVYLIPSLFPEGTLYLVAGVLIILVTILNAFKNIAYDRFNLLFATVSIVIGINKILSLELPFLPAILLTLGIIALFVNLKRLK